MEGAFRMLAEMVSSLRFDVQNAPGPPVDLAAFSQKFPAAALKRPWKRDSASTLVPDGDGILWVSLGP